MKGRSAQTDADELRTEYEFDYAKGRKNMNATEFKAKCLAMIDRAARGEEVRITKRRRVVARPVPATLAPRATLDADATGAWPAPLSAMSPSSIDGSRRSVDAAELATRRLWAAATA